MSHGCVNLSPANAETYYKLAVPGDPVTITGSPRAAPGTTAGPCGSCPGAAVDGSALNEAVRTGPQGSTFVGPTTLRPATAKSPLDAPKKGNAAAG